MIKRRVQLIDLIKKGGKTIVSAAKKLKIKISTAKSILYSFEKNGKVLKKKKSQKTDKFKNSGYSSL
jgi:transposase